MYLIGIAGGSGSGKTTFAQKILQRLPRQKVSLLHQDNYYLSRQVPENFVDGKPNFDSPQAFDWNLFRQDLARLKMGKSIRAPVYDFEKSKRSKETIEVGPGGVVIVEGILALWDEEVRAQMNLKIYLKVESDIRFIRRLYRDISDRGRQLDGIIGQYYKTVRPMHQKYTQPTQEYADMVVGEHHDAAVEVLVNEVRMRLGLGEA